MFTSRSSTHLNNVSFLFYSHSILSLPFLGNSSWIPPPHLFDEAEFERKPSKKNLWLFNVKDDPTEHKDLSDTYPQIVKKLLDRLVYYNSTMVPVRYPKPDPRCDPKYHGGAWGPWEE